jgi:hypothetical protein
MGPARAIPIRTKESLTSTARNGDVVSLELPLMYVKPGRMLMQLYTSFDELSAFDHLRRSVQEAGAVMKMAWAYYQPEHGTFQGLLTIDATGTAAATSDLTQKLAAIPGVDLIQTTPSEPSLTAAERNTLQVAGTPMVVMAREVLGGAFQPSPRPASRARSTRPVCSWEGSPPPRYHSCSIG